MSVARLLLLAPAAPGARHRRRVGVVRRQRVDLRHLEGGGVVARAFAVVTFVVVGIFFVAPIFLRRPGSRLRVFLLLLLLLLQRRRRRRSSGGDGSSGLALTLLLERVRLKLLRPLRLRHLHHLLRRQSLAIRTRCCGHGRHLLQHSLLHHLLHLKGGWLGGLPPALLRRRLLQRLRLEISQLLLL